MLFFRLGLQTVATAQGLLTARQLTKLVKQCIHIVSAALLSVLLIACNDVGPHIDRNGSNATRPQTTESGVTVPLFTGAQPVAVADNFSTVQDTGISANLATNDSGLDDTPVSFYLETPPSNGIVSIAVDGSFSYTPGANFLGVDSFEYGILDTHNDFDTAVVTITVEANPVTPGAAQINGQVVTAVSLLGPQPIANAEVTLLFNNTTVSTDSEGNYSFPVTLPLPIAEEYLAVSVSAAGFRPREMNVSINSNTSTATSNAIDTSNTVALARTTQYTYFQPVQLDDGLTTGTLVENNVDSNIINDLMNKAIRQGAPLGYEQLHSLLIYKDGELILEEYNIGNDDFIRFEDNIARDSSRPDKQWSRTEKHYLASVNKSLTATVAGIALDQYGLVVDDKISLLLPDEAFYFSDANKAALSLHHMLTMQLGFDWDEWGSNDLAQMWQSNDFTEFLLNRNNTGPESAWVYNSASPNMLLKGLDNLVDGGIRSWADSNFYSKLGISDYNWIAQPDGIPEGAARMHMRPRDMLKVGITYLNNGIWNGEQVIPTAWVEEVFKVQVAGFAGDYSYFFWHRDINGIPYISADGDGGQYINIFPDRNMVIVMTQGNYLEFPLYVNQANDIMGTYILPAVAN